MRNYKNAIYWLKGTNGSGKTTIPHYMLENSLDEEIELIYSEVESKKPKVIATIFKKFNLASVGPYERGKTFGGCDALNKTQILEALQKLENIEVDVFVEGILSGNGTLGTGKARNGESYYNLLKNYPRESRNYLFIDIKWETVIERIKARTGKTDEDIDALKTVKDKYDASAKHQAVYEGLGEIRCLNIDNNGTKEEFVSKFLNNF